MSPARLYLVLRYTGMDWRHALVTTSRARPKAGWGEILSGRPRLTFPSFSLYPRSRDDR